MPEPPGLRVFFAPALSTSPAGPPSGRSERSHTALPGAALRSPDLLLGRAPSAPPPPSKAIAVHKAGLNPNHSPLGLLRIESADYHRSSSCADPPRPAGSPLPQSTRPRCPDCLRRLFRPARRTARVSGDRLTTKAGKCAKRSTTPRGATGADREKNAPRNRPRDRPLRASRPPDSHRIVPSYGWPVCPRAAASPPSCPGRASAPSAPQAQPKPQPATPAMPLLRLPHLPRNPYAPPDGPVSTSADTSTGVAASA